MKTFLVIAVCSLMVVGSFAQWWDNDFDDDEDFQFARLGGGFAGRGFINGKPCNQGYIHRPKFGKGYGSSKFRPVFQKQVMHKPMYGKNMYSGASSMYQSGPVVSAGSIGGHYPSYQGSSMYHGASVGSIGGNYPSYQGSNMYHGASNFGVSSSGAYSAYPSY